MSSVQQTLSDLESRRRRLKFRAWHRGMRETDLILGPFCDAMMDRFTPDGIAAFERLLDASDPDLLAWVMGERLPPDDQRTPLFHALVAFHIHAKPKHL